MDEDTFQGFVFKALLWGIAYYFIRKGLNPANKDLEKFKLSGLMKLAISSCTNIIKIDIRIIRFTI